MFLQEFGHDLILLHELGFELCDLTAAVPFSKNNFCQP
jgi:hypothetical protein